MLLTEGETLIRSYTAKYSRSCLENAFAIGKLQDRDAAERGLGLPVLGLNISLGDVVDLDCDVVVLSSNKDLHGLVVALGGVESEHFAGFCDTDWNVGSLCAFVVGLI